jgi:NADH:ubiquinone oxidoreductase subunit K
MILFLLHFCNLCVYVCVVLLLATGLLTRRFNTQELNSIELLLKQHTVYVVQTSEL